MEKLKTQNYTEEDIENLDATRVAFITRAESVANDYKVELIDVIHTYALATGKYVEKNLNNEEILKSIFEDNLIDELYWDITETILQKEIAEKLATIDALTGIPNRHSMDEKLKQFAERQERSGTNFSLILLDLDYFKSINDNFGHQLGDQILKRVAKLLIDDTRPDDMPFRYGGEEMGVVVKGDLNQAALIAERIRLDIQKLTASDFDVAENIKPISASFGVAEYKRAPKNPDTLEETRESIDEAIVGVLKRADDSLYKAKMGGRNQVIISE